MKKLTALILAILMLLSLCACGDSGKTSTDDTAAENKTDDKVYELVFNHLNSESSVHGQAATAWMDAVEEASGGRIKFVRYWSGAAASATDAPDALESGLIDLMWGGNNQYPGRFIATALVSCPMVGVPVAGEGGAVLYRYFNEVEACRDEFGAKIRVIYTTVNGNVIISNSQREIKTVDDFKGLRIRQGNTSQGAFIEALGATVMSFSTFDTYENISKSVADGTITDWDFYSWNAIAEVCPYFLDYSVAINPGFVIMSQAAYDKLPADLQAIIDQFSGVAPSVEYTAFIAANDASQREKCQSDGAVLTAPDQTLIDALTEAGMGAGYAAWEAEATAAGYDATALHEALLKIIEEECG